MTSGPTRRPGNHRHDDPGAPVGGIGARLAVCFVCTGNICRSPMADVVLRRLAATLPLDDGAALSDHLDISSAGTTGWHRGEGMDPRARAALEQRGYVDHGHHAQQFETRWFGTTDLVVCLDRGHRRSLLGLGREAAADGRLDQRLVLLRTYDPTAGSTPDVPDPYYGDDADFEDCLTLVERACRGLADRLADMVGGRAAS